MQRRKFRQGVVLAAIPSTAGCTSFTGTGTGSGGPGVAGETLTLTTTSTYDTGLLDEIRLQFEEVYAGALGVSGFPTVRSGRLE